MSCAWLVMVMVAVPVLLWMFLLFWELLCVHVRKDIPCSTKLRMFIIIPFRYPIGHYTIEHEQIIYAAHVSFGQGLSTTSQFTVNSISLLIPSTLGSRILED
jgi:hypothetical protein